MEYPPKLTSEAQNRSNMSSVRNLLSHFVIDFPPPRKHEIMY